MSMDSSCFQSSRGALTSLYLTAYGSMLVPDNFILDSEIRSAEDKEIINSSSVTQKLAYLLACCGGTGACAFVHNGRFIELHLPDKSFFPLGISETSGRSAARIFRSRRARYLVRLF